MIHIPMLADPTIVRAAAIKVHGVERVDEWSGFREAVHVTFLNNNSLKILIA